MNSPVLFSTRVIDTINSLDSDERTAITTALTDEFILKREPSVKLSAIQRMIYAIISRYVIQDSRRACMASDVVALGDLAVG